MSYKENHEKPIAFSRRILDTFFYSYLTWKCSKTSWKNKFFHKERFYIFKIKYCYKFDNILSPKYIMTLNQRPKQSSVQIFSQIKTLI